MTIRKPITIDYVDTILHFREHDFDVEKLTLQAGSTLVGRTLGELILREDYGMTLLAINRGDDILGNPSVSAVLLGGDLMIMFGKRDDLVLFEKAANASLVSD